MLKSTREVFHKYQENITAIITLAHISKSIYMTGTAETILPKLEILEIDSKLRHSR